jgi:hypothetical protein
LVKPRRWVMQTSGALAPAPFGRPQAERSTGRTRPVPASVRHRPGSALSRTRLVAGEPPDPVPLGRELQASGGRVPATRCPGRPQLQARVQPFPHSWHAGSGAPGPPAPPLAVVAGSARTLQTRTAPSRLETASRSARRSQQPDNGRGDPDRRARIRPGGRNQALSPDRPENEAAGSCTRPLNESAHVLTPGKSGVIDMRGGGWALGRRTFFATLRTAADAPPTHGLLAPSVSR